MILILSRLLSFFLITSAQAEVTSPLPVEVLNIRDPFKRPLIVNEKVEPKTELEAFPSDQYKMIGVITGLDNLRAIVVDPNGKTHFVSDKMKIGTRKGIVTTITNDSIKVRERMINVIGQEESVDVEIRLPAENINATPAELNASEILPQAASPIGKVDKPLSQQVVQAPVQAPPQAPQQVPVEQQQYTQPSQPTSQFEGPPAPPTGQTQAPSFMSPIYKKK